MRVNGSNRENFSCGNFAEKKKPGKPGLFRMRLHGFP